MQAEKRLVRDFFQVLETASPASLRQDLGHFLAEEYRCYACSPFDEMYSLEEVVARFWAPLRAALTSFRRRQEVFLAGVNQADGKVWIISMGNYQGLFDRPWLDIPPTGRLVLLRYAEFHCVEDGRITASAHFPDLIGLLRQAGCNPLPEETGCYFNYPGPRTQDGLLFEEQSAAASAQTLALVEEMVADLDGLNRSGNDLCPPELLQKTWRDDLVWYGPAGIGASYTIPAYQAQHQYPFRLGLKNKVFNGHVCRIAEGDYAGFFGWPNLNNTPAGGFLGLPGNAVHAPMRVVDIYRREGARLAENWVFIDLPHWLARQGLDVFARLRHLRGG